MTERLVAPVWLAQVLKPCRHQLCNIQVDRDLASARPWI